MNYLIAIDDTDMPGTKGTGWLAQEMGQEMIANGMGAISPISRHQLFVHEDVPFTSHNSSMCFEFSCTCGEMDRVTAFMIKYLESRSIPGSDPGLCILPLAGEDEPGSRSGLKPEFDPSPLIRFGCRAKKEVLTKDQAYGLAQDLGIHLTEHGGTGQGVVGALAGIGLRLSGNDGRYRGWYHLGQPGDVVPVDRLCQYDFIDALVTPQGEALPLESRVSIGSAKTKTVRLDSRQVEVVVENEASRTSGIAFRTITKQEAKAY